MEEVILVDEFDNQTSTIGKVEAHQLGLLHRAFSILIFNSKNEMLIQKRAITKYHSGGLWTNACCSHPRPNEDLKAAADRRLMEELGISCELKWSFSFQYKIKFENGLTENELDHVFLGVTDELPKINPDEIDDWQYVSKEELEKNLAMKPNDFTHWFQLIMQKLPKFAADIH